MSVEDARVKIQGLLRSMVERGASDLHITVGTPPQMRIDGEVHPERSPPLTDEETRDLCYALLTPEQRATFERERELDFSFSVRNLCRFRANVYLQKGSVAAALRTIPFRILTAEDLGLPQAVSDLANKPNGLILVTGPTGSGKSTTLTSIVDKINTEQHVHILTISETGHLVFGTLHTNGAVSTINRIIDVFPPHQQDQIRTKLSFVLQAVLSQQLLPKVGGGRCMSLEILLPTPAIRAMMRDGKIHQIYGNMQVGQGKFGMQTMNQSLYSLAARRMITVETALGYANEPEELRQMFTNAQAQAQAKR
ncbi:MAG: type IV pili twitching motility protein PilT [Proteobacteria bacterium]|nr:MAG: type IV pili twitching motility protein PilT [Pseudomonadota bacterium]